MMKRTCILTFVLCGLLCSCSSLQTGLIPKSASSAKLQLPYYLPKGLITIDVVYKPKTRTVKKITESNGPSGPIKITETKEETIPDNNEKIPVITTSVTYVADESMPRLYAQYVNNIFSKDTIDIKTDSEGLLTTAEGQSEDKSLIVIENLALAALEVGKFIYGGGLGLPTTTKGAPVTIAKREVAAPPNIHITFDPTDRCELFIANCILLESGLDLREGLRHSKGYEANSITFNDNQKYSGLLFRPLRFYRLYQVDNGPYKEVCKKLCKELFNEEFKESSNEDYRKKCREKEAECEKEKNRNVAKGKQEKLIASFAVPDPTQHYCVPLTRRAFVASITKLEIEKGMLKGLHIEKDSEAEAISGLPLRLIEKLVSLPQGILVYQSNQIEAETKLIEAQTRQIEALQALEKARQAAQ